MVDGALAGVGPGDLARLRTRALTRRVVWPRVTRVRTAERTALKKRCVDVQRVTYVCR